MKLGCIADDFTGATDLANNLVRSGMRVVQTIGVPKASLPLDADAVVVALKSRTVPAADAVRMALEALEWLRAHGAEQFYFKYCSTFDSTSAGNIGPVTDALMDALATDFTIACPAFPDNGRTVFNGYLFVGDLLLHESGMRNHPLTPMAESNLVRVLQAQTMRKVGLLDHAHVRRGAGSIRDRISALKRDGVQVAIVDATDNDDLVALGPALADLPLVTAGSGVAIGLARNFGITPGDLASELPAASGARAIVSGSCSVATNAQVVDFRRRGGASLAIDPLRLIAGEDVVNGALAWAEPRLSGEPVLIFATAEGAAVRAVQDKIGAERAGQVVEEALSAIARGLVSLGVRQLIVAGGETSGSCVQALGIEWVRIGQQIAPGVPWCHAHSPFAAANGIHIALKSGNFGEVDFFSTAFGLLDS